MFVEEMNDYFLFFFWIEVKNNKIKNFKLLGLFIFIYKYNSLL